MYRIEVAVKSPTTNESKSIFLCQFYESGKMYKKLWAFHYHSFQRKLVLGSKQIGRTIVIQRWVKIDLENRI